MGAQAAALLDAGGPVGVVPEPARVAGSLRLAAPEPYDLDRVARGHGGVGLAPSAWDAERLHRVLRLTTGLVPVVVDRELDVTWSVPGPDEVQIRRQLHTVLALDDDLGELHDACDRLPSLSWVRRHGAGRVLRAPTAFEDLAATLASTNTSYAATRRMMACLVEGAFPTPEQVAAMPDDRLRAAGWGYRAGSLTTLASRVVDGLDVEAWRDPDRSDDEVLARVRELPGFGPFAAATALPLLGHRPRPMVLDGWLRRQVLDPEAYRALGRWAGTGLWLALTAGRGSERHAARGPIRTGTPAPP